MSFKKGTIHKFANIFVVCIVSICLSSTILVSQKQKKKEVISQKRLKKITKNVTKTAGENFIDYIKDLNRKKLSEEKRNNIFNKLMNIYNKNEDFRESYLKFVNLHFKILFTPNKIEVKSEDTGWGWESSLLAYGLRGKFLFRVITPELASDGKLNWMENLPIDRVLSKFKNIWGKNIFRHYEKVTFGNKHDKIPRYLVKLMLRDDPHYALRTFVNKSNNLGKSQKKKLLAAGKYIKSKMTKISNDGKTTDFNKGFYEKVHFLLSHQVWWIDLYVAECFRAKPDLANKDILRKLQNIDRSHIKNIVEKIKQK